MGGTLSLHHEITIRLTTIIIFRTFDRRSLVSDGLAPQAPGDANTIWCAAGGSTYIAVTLTAASVSAERALYIVSQALNRINFQIANYGDGLIPMGMFIQAGKDTSKELYIANRNNHQQTWVSRALL